MDPETTPDLGNSVDTDAAQPAQTDNWEQRFKDTQAAFTKAQQTLKEQEGVWEDEDALLARIGEKYPHLLMDDEPADDEPEFVPAEDPPAHDPRVDQALPQLQHLLEREAERQYQEDLSQLLGDRDVGEQGRKFIRAMTAQGGDNYKALEGAVNEWFSAFPEDDSKPGKKAPHVLTGGKAVDVGAPPNYSEMTPEESWEAMAARVRALEARG